MKERIKQLQAGLEKEKEFLLDELANARNDLEDVYLSDVSINSEDYVNRKKTLQQNLDAVKDDIKMLERRFAIGVLALMRSGLRSGDLSTVVLKNLDTNTEILLTLDNFEVFQFFAENAKFYWDEDSLTMIFNNEILLV